MPNAPGRLGRSPMIEMLPLTPALLSELGEELDGCDFTDPSHAEFLAKTISCDVQAAPGNGKTTLLAAKLALLSRSWSTRRRGICVISHTNAARAEVEGMIARHHSAVRLLSYPHYVGTVTAFINQFLALPYLRGLGWSMRQIDDEVFAAEALRRLSSFWALKQHAARAGATVEAWVTKLDLDPAFDDARVEPERLVVQRRKGQHGADTNCGRALEKLKASMVRSGLYRYADMSALAWRALNETPMLASRLRDRFPLVILDEAQDTNGEHHRLLEYVFRHDGVAFQRLGDINQTLYEDDGPAPAYWTPSSDCIPLDTSRRFGADIARFASRLTVKHAQKIVGLSAKPSSRILILFDEATIASVLQAFATAASTLWGADCSRRDIWVVASRHSSPGKKGGWLPKSLVNYHAAYRAENGVRAKAHLLCHQLRKAATAHAAGRSPAEVSEMLAIGAAGLARVHGWKAANGRPITSRNVWPTLSDRDPTFPVVTRRLLRDHVLVGEAPWEEAAWSEFIEKLLPLFGSSAASASAEIGAYCGFVFENPSVDATPDRRSSKVLEFGDVTLRLGSIHSVKGKSVDGILVVESEVWKGRATNEQCFDLSTVLPHAFGVADESFTGVKQVAATNVFVGVTRPRELLGLALRRSAATRLVSPAREQGWTVVDLVAGATQS